MAATEIYLDPSGKTVIVDNGVASTAIIDVDAFNFDKNDEDEYFVLRDANDDWKLKVLASDAAFSGGALIGSYASVYSYLNGLIPESVIGVVTGNSEVPSTVEEVYSLGVNETGSTISGIRSFSILFEGTGGKLNGVPVVSGYVNSKSASLGNTLDSESYTIPTAGDVDFPVARVIISYTS